MLIDMAAQLGEPFEVFSLDTGRLHAQTYQFIERVRDHYGVAIELLMPDPDAVGRLVRDKGLFSFYRDGDASPTAALACGPTNRSSRCGASWPNWTPGSPGNAVTRASRASTCRKCRPTPRSRNRTRL